MSKPNSRDLERLLDLELAEERTSTGSRRSAYQELYRKGRKHCSGWHPG